MIIINNFFKYFFKDTFSKAPERGVKASLRPVSDYKFFFKGLFLKAPKIGIMLFHDNRTIIYSFK